MKKIVKEVYQSCDGKIFETEEECKEYEASRTDSYQVTVRFYFDIPFNVEARTTEEAKEIALEEARDIDDFDLIESNECNIMYLGAEKIEEDE